MNLHTEFQPINLPILNIKTVVHRTKCATFHLPTVLQS